MDNKGLWKEHPIEFRCWSLMKQRCYNERHPQYQYWGGRGIVVCAQWLQKGSGFATFLADMGKRPGLNYSIERRNVDGNYEPSNCYWATTKQQNNNTRRNIKLTYKDETLSLTQWSEKLGIPFERVRTRYRYGWPVEKIFETDKNKHTKVRADDSRSVMYAYQGKTQNLSLWSRELEIPYDVLRSRLRYNWSVERAFSTPHKKRG